MKDPIKGKIIRLNKKKNPQPVSMLFFRSITLISFLLTTFAVVYEAI